MDNGLQWVMVAPYKTFITCIWSKIFDTGRDVYRVSIKHADLHGCIENLNTRVIDLAARAERCKQEAVYHLLLAKKEPASVGASASSTARACHTSLSDQADDATGSAIARWKLELSHAACITLPDQGMVKLYLCI